MTTAKRVSVSFRVSPDFKQLLEAAAEKEHRSQTNMLEILLHAYCEEHSITVDQVDSPSRKKKKK